MAVGGADGDVGLAAQHLSAHLVGFEEAYDAGHSELRHDAAHYVDGESVRLALVVDEGVGPVVPAVYVDDGVLLGVLALAERILRSTCRGVKAEEQCQHYANEKGGMAHNAHAATAFRTAAEGTHGSHSAFS